MRKDLPLLVVAGVACALRGVSPVLSHHKRVVLSRSLAPTNYQHLTTTTTTLVRSRRSELRALCLDAPVLKPVPAVEPVLTVLMACVAALAAFRVVLAVLGSEFRENLRHWWRLRVGSVKALLETIRYLWTEATGGETATVLVDAWAPCLLETREESLGYTTYRFALRSGPNTVLPLEVGQAVAVMSIDTKNRVVRADCWLASSRRDADGYVDVVAPTKARRDRWLQTPGAFDPEAAQLLDALDAVDIGAETAVRPGRKGFQYRGGNLPITSLQCFVQDLGVLPVLHLLQESLPRGRSTVKNGDVFWLNEDEADFRALYDRLEDLYYTYNNKMTLSCIVDDQLCTAPPAASEAGGDSDDALAPVPAREGVFLRNPELRASVQPWQPGTLAIVAGPPLFSDDVASYLEANLGYPRDCILVF